MIALCAASAKGWAWIDVGAHMSAGSVSAQSYLARNRTRRSLADALRASVKGVGLAFGAETLALLLP